MGAGVSASMWEQDWPAPKHEIRCAVWVTHNDPCDCGADEELHPADHFGYPIDDPLEDLLRPDAGTLADRLEELGRRIHPRDGDGAA